MVNKRTDPFVVYTCVCGKTFIPTPQYVYKLCKHNKNIYYCSYSCWRKAGGGGSNGARNYHRFE